jgi:hypothetical protein
MGLQVIVRVPAVGTTEPYFTYSMIVLKIREWQPTWRYKAQMPEAA